MAQALGLLEFRECAVCGRRFRFIMHLKHASSCGDAGSSYIFNTPPHYWRYKFMTCLRYTFSSHILIFEHASSFANSVCTFGEPAPNFRWAAVFGLRPTRPAARSLRHGYKRERGGWGGAQAPRPFATTMSVSGGGGGSETIYMRSGFCWQVVIWKLTCAG